MMLDLFQFIYALFPSYSKMLVNKTDLDFKFEMV